MWRGGVALGTAVLLALTGCAVRAEPIAASSAEPEGVLTAAPDEDPASATRCLVRRSFPPSAARPGTVAARTLIAGVDLSDPTMSHWNAATRQFEGFNIDLLLAVAQRLWPGADPRKKITFRAVQPGTEALARLDLSPEDPGYVDVVATSITATCEQAARVLFSNDYLDSGQTALVRRAPGIGTINDRPQYAGMDELGGHRVCAGAGTTSLTNVQRYRTRTGQRLIAVQAEHPIDCLVLLRQGAVDAVSTDENVLRGFTLMAPDTTLVTEPPQRQSCKFNQQKPCTWFTDEPHAFAFGRGNRELTGYVNYVLETMRDSGVWARAHERWLGQHPDLGMPVPGPPVQEWPW